MILYSSGRLKDMKRKHLKNNQIERHYDGYLTKNKWDNTHSDFMSMDTNKMYTYYSDIYIETPFFETIQRRYEAVEFKYQVFGKTATKGRCPCCNKRSAYFTTTRDGNTFRVVCANDKCIFPNGKSGMLLHEIIMTYQTDMIKEWRDARYTKKNYYGWYGIKPENRRKASRQFI